MLKITAKGRKVRNYAIGILLVTGLATGYAANSTAEMHEQQVAAHTAPDWTVEPCSAWANTEFPKLPAYTYTDRCVAPDGSIVFAPKK